MIRAITTVSILMLVSFVLSQPLSAGQPGTTDTVFNKMFIKTVKPMMAYDQLVALLGSPGIQIGEDTHSPVPKLSYHWNGGRNSALDIKVASEKITEMTLISPNKQKYSLGKNGEVVDLGN